MSPTTGAPQHGAKVAHAFLGIQTAPFDRAVARAMTLKPDQRGALVGRVTSGSPAEKAGLRGGRIETVQDFSSAAT